MKKNQFPALPRPRTFQDVLNIALPIRYRIRVGYPQYNYDEFFDVPSEKKEKTYRIQDNVIAFVYNDTMYAIPYMKIVKTILLENSFQENSEMRMPFQNWGFPVKIILDRKRFDREAETADACILFYRWRKKARLGAHFVALHHTDKGFVGYNTFRNSTGPDHYGDSLEGFLKARSYFGCVLMAICKK